MTAQEIQELFDQQGIFSDSVFLLDSAYRLPDRKWLFSEFAGAFEAFKQSLGANQYTPESNDCDDFTGLAVWYARFLHARGKTADSIAFGSFVYLQESGAGHSICCAVVNDNGPTLVFFEPQNSTEAFLTEAEIVSCSLAVI